MANRNKIKPVEAGKRINDPTNLPTARSSQPEKSDDLIGTLSDAYENQRARQVGEWEKQYVENVYRAGA